MGGDRTAVIGVGQTRHVAARHDVWMAGLVREAAVEALEDAGMDFDDIDAVVVGKAPDTFEGVMMPELYLADALGAVGKPLLRVHTAGSVGGATGIVAASLVQAGLHRRVLALAGTSRRTSAPTSGAAARRRTSARWSRSRTGATAPSTRTPTCSRATSRWRRYWRPRCCGTRCGTTRRARPRTARARWSSGTPMPLLWLRARWPGSGPPRCAASRPCSRARTTSTRPRAGSAWRRCGGRPASATR